MTKKPIKEFQPLNAYHIERSKAAVLAVQVMAKNPSSMEEKRAQVARIQEQIDEARPKKQDLKTKP